MLFCVTNCWYSPPIASGPVVSLSVDPMVITLSVSWRVPDMSNGVITGYEVSYQEEDGVQAGTLTGIVTTELMGLKPGTIYNISVVAINDAGDGDITYIQGTTLVICK